MSEVGRGEANREDNMPERIHLSAGHSISWFKLLQLLLICQHMRVPSQRAMRLEGFLFSRRLQWYGPPVERRQQWRRCYCARRKQRCLSQLMSSQPLRLCCKPPLAHHHWPFPISILAAVLGRVCHRDQLAARSDGGMLCSRADPALSGQRWRRKPCNGLQGTGSGGELIWKFMTSSWANQIKAGEKVWQLDLMSDQMLLPNSRRRPLRCESQLISEPLTRSLSSCLLAR